MKIYLAHPISGLSYDEVVDYYETTTAELISYGYEVLSPMTAKGYLRNELELRAEGYSNPASTNHAIIERDAWMVRMADVVYINFQGLQSDAIGCTMELGWAYILGKHSVVNLAGYERLKHAFILEAADIVYGVHDDAMLYLYKLIKGGM